MEILTYKNKDGYYVDGKNGKSWSDKYGQIYGEHIDKLAEYENTGYTPADFDNLCRLMSDIKIEVGFCTFGELRDFIKNGGKLIAMNKDDVKADRKMYYELYKKDNLIKECQQVIGELGKDILFYREQINSIYNNMREYESIHKQRE